MLKTALIKDLFLPAYKKPSYGQIPYDGFWAVLKVAICTISTNRRRFLRQNARNTIVFLRFLLEISNY